MDALKPLSSPPAELEVPDDLTGIDWRDQNLAGLDLSHRDLSGADLTRADLSGADLSHSQLSGASLYQAVLTDCELVGADLSGANLTQTRGHRVGLAGTNLTGALLFDADLEDASLSNAVLVDADLRTAHLHRARLRCADLRGAQLDRADLRQADTEDARLDGASFRDADLRGAHVKGVTGYDRATFIRADIRDVDFCGAYMVRRYIMDQNYLDEFRRRNRWTALAYRIWWLTSDCGRSATRWAAWTLAVAIVFAGLFRLVELDYGGRESAISSLYYSIVTLTTLGYGDIVPASGAAQTLASVEVVIGYVALGGLLSIVSNKMARRAE